VISERVLREMPAVLGEQFGLPTIKNERSFQVGVGPDGAQVVSGSEERFIGWRAEQKGEANWIVQVGGDRITLNCVRPQSWPRGPYVGWMAIEQRFRRLLETTERQYANLSPKRVGVRYINRILLPMNSVPDRYFTLALQAPRKLKCVFSFDWQQTWSEFEGNPGYSATVRLGRLAVEEAQFAGRWGLLLDIDVFNLMVADAPDRGRLLHWIGEAHNVENEVFEASITDALRAELNVR
jgi:uncharacterized protein (TIGR04255 family)